MHTSSFYPVQMPNGTAELLVLPRTNADWPGGEDAIKIRLLKSQHHFKPKKAKKKAPVTDLPINIIPFIPVPNLMSDDINSFEYIKGGINNFNLIIPWKIIA